MAKPMTTVEAGRLGGRKSRRALSSEDARRMVRVRDARRAYRDFYSTCFWSFDPALVITVERVPWVAAQLRRNGGMDAWRVAAKLCR